LALTPGTRLGPYDITAQIGAGGMGEVYRATDTNLDRVVALKVLPESFALDADRVARFTREAKTLAAVNHTNIAAIYGLEKAKDVTALVMELVEGEDLSAHIARGAMPLADALPIARQIADALEAAHGQGIIHRDLKPANIKVRPDGTVKVLDFGLAKAMDPAGPSSADAMNSPTLTARATQMGMIIGTAAYMAPEQARGRTVDRRADIWAFGCVLFEMLTGQRAFPGEDITDTLAAVVRAEPDWRLIPAGLSPTLLAFLKRCLQKDPKQRIGDIHDVRLALDGAFETTAPPTPASPSRASGGRVAWVVSTAAGLAVALLVVPAVRHLRETAPDQQSYRFQITPPAGTRFTTFRLSPDGRYVAYIAAEGGAQGAAAGTLWIRALESLESRQIPGSEGSLYPFWSPDSAVVGFFQTGKLKKVVVTGGPVQAICDVVSARGGAWGPDGTILFADGPGSPTRPRTIQITRGFGWGRWTGAPRYACCRTIPTVCSRKAMSSSGATGR
jgi:serine/threonine protein kinase